MYDKIHYKVYRLFGKDNRKKMKKIKIEPVKENQ